MQIVHSLLPGGGRLTEDQFDSATTGATDTIAGTKAALIDAGLLRVVAKPIRIAPVDSDLAYVIAPHPDYGAIGFKMERNTGATASAPNLGPPQETWRLTAVYALATVEDDPATDGTVIGSDNGAWDYAFQISSIPEYGGSWHGGETLVSYSGTDLTAEGYVPSFRAVQQSTVDFSNGVQIAIDRSFAISATGVITETISASSAGVVSTRTLGMLILQSAFDQYSVDGGANYIALPADDSIVDLGDPTDLLLRNPVTGHTVRQVTNAPSQPQYTRISGRRQSRTKTYIEFDTAGVLGTIGDSRTVTFGASEPDPVPAWEPFTETFDDAGSPEVPAGWTRTHPSTGTGGLFQVTGGKWTITGVNSQPNRAVDTSRPLPPGTYTIAMDFETPDGGATSGSLQVAPDNTGGTTGLLASTNFTVGAGVLTATLNVTVPDGQQGFIGVVASNTTGRRTIFSEMRVTGTPA